MKLKYRIIVGQRFFAPKLDWEKIGNSWQAKPEGALHLYEVEYERSKTKENCPVWHLYINSRIANEKINKKGRFHLAMVYSNVTAMAIAELLEAKEKDFLPEKNRKPKVIFVGKEERIVDDGDWEIQGDKTAHLHNFVCGYKIALSNNRSKNQSWRLGIVCPGGVGIMENCEAWEFGGIESLEVGQAIVALMEA